MMYAMLSLNRSQEIISVLIILSCHTKSSTILALPWQLSVSSLSWRCFLLLLCTTIIFLFYFLYTATNSNFLADTDSFCFEQIKHFVMPNIPDYKSSLRISVSLFRICETICRLLLLSSFSHVLKRRKVGEKATTKTKATHDETLTLTHISILVIKWIFGCISDQNTCHFQTKNHTHFTWHIQVCW